MVIMKIKILNINVTAAAMLVLLACFLNNFAQTPDDGAAAKVSAETRVNALITAVNLNNRAAMGKFVGENFTKAALERTPLEARLNTFSRMFDETRGLTIVGVRETKPNEATALVKSKLTGQLSEIAVEVETQSPYQISVWRLRPQPAKQPGETSPAKKLSDDEIVGELENYLKKLADADVFSGAVLLARNDKVLFKRAYGFANKDFQIPNRLDTRFNLASMGKMFTAIAVAQLVERGKLSYEDTLAKHLPGVIDQAAAEKIKIKHLLSHTSGLGSYFTEKFYNSSRTRFRSIDDFFELVKDDKAAFEPGTNWKYSNNGFQLLGKIVEKVSGQDYFEYLRENIFKPAGMNATEANELDRVNPNLAVGYGKEFTDRGTVFRANTIMLPVKGGPAGGGYSTVEDVMRFTSALQSGKLVSAETAKLLMSPKPELASPNYGYGFLVYTAHNAVGHPGDFNGISTSLEIYPDSGYTVIILSNYDSTRQMVMMRAQEMIQASKH